MANRNTTPIYQRVTDRIILELEKGSSPWRRPWRDGKALPGLPYNAASSRNYSGINTCLLWTAGEEYQCNGWLTYRQSKELGGYVRKGEKGHQIIYWNLHDIEDGDETKTIPFARAYTVFNVAQCEGLSKLPALAKPEPLGQDDIRDFVAGTGAEIRHGGNRSFFCPSDDYIQIPHPSQFHAPSDYHATLLHELTHWTGHEARLARAFGRRFGDDAYSFEELIAEIGPCFLQAHLQVPGDLTGHRDYLASWLRILKADNRAIFTAASQAQKACDYVLKNARVEAMAA